MTVIDSCGWIEIFTNGPTADTYAALLGQLDRVLVPTIVFYEVYKILARSCGEETALRCNAFMRQAQEVPLDAGLALEAADAALKHQLAMADAIVYTTAARHDAELATSDSDLRGLPGVRFIAK